MAATEKNKNKPVRVLKFLNNGIYPGHILFSVGYNLKEIHDKLIKMKYTDYAEGIREKTWTPTSVGTAFSVELIDHNTKDECELFYIILKKFEFTDFDYCILAHEITHMCQFYFKSTCINRNNEIESEAHYHTHLMKQCLQIMRDNHVSQ